jgi:hypothetical protein
MVSVVLILSTLASIIQLANAGGLMYDLNFDGKVDLKDVYLVGKAFGSSPGDPKWNPLADVNRDGRIDLKDYFVLAKHFGHSSRILVVPEYWMGTVLGLAGCFAAFGLFRVSKRKSP